MQRNNNLKGTKNKEGKKERKKERKNERKKERLLNKIYTKRRKINLCCF